MELRGAIEPNTWAVKGDAHVFGFVRNDDNDITAVALSATQSQATIHAGKNFPAAGTTDEDTITAARKNPNIDNPRKPATAEIKDVTEILLFDPKAQNIANNQINTSIQPILISDNDLNIEDAESRAGSCKVFTHFNYTWIDKEEWIPYLGLGSEVEFDHGSDDTSDCPKCGISQWGIWVKGGITC